MKKKLRILTLCLTAVMLFSMLPFTANAAQPDTIALDDVKTVVIEISDAYVDFYFTPTETGYYGFASVDYECDPYGYIYKDTEIIASNDDAGEDLNFRVTAWLTAGVQYTFRAKAYSTNTGTMKVKLFKMVEPTAIEAFEDRESIRINVGSYLYFNTAYFPTECYTVPITYTSSDPQILDIDDDFLLPLSPGTVTVTATTESGLSDTIKITVEQPLTIKPGDSFTSALSNPTTPTYKFTATKDADYVFHIGITVADWYVYPEAYVLDANTFEHIASSRTIGQADYLYFTAEKGTTYYLVTNTSTYRGTAKYSLSELTDSGSLTSEYSKYYSYPGDIISPVIVPDKINSNIDYENITFTSSDPEIIDSFQDGRLACYKEGSATITATNDDGLSTTFKVNVLAPTEITSTGTYTFETKPNQRNNAFIFTPQTSGTYYFNYNFHSCYVSADAETTSDGGYIMTAGISYYLICYGVYGKHSFDITKKAPDCDEHEWTVCEGLAPTILTETYQIRQCVVCGKYGYIELDKLPVKKAANKQFIDVKKKDWFYTSVNFAFNSNLFAGTSETKFSPDDNMTRGMFVTVLGRLAGIPANNKVTTKFADVKKNQYYTGYVKWANEAGIVNGITATTFDPEANITREQICVMMTKFIDYVGMTLRNDTPAIKFKDSAKISKWAKEAVADCQQGGIINGSKSGSGYVFNPQGNATRAEVATIIYNFVRNYPYAMTYEFYRHY